MMSDVLGIDNFDKRFAMQFESSFEVAVEVGGIDDREVEFYDQLMNSGPSKDLFWDRPMPIHPTAQRSNAALLQTIIFRQGEVIDRLAIRRIENNPQFVSHVLDERIPGGKAHCHRHAGADEQYRIALANCPHKIFSIVHCRSKTSAIR